MSGSGSVDAFGSGSGVLPLGAGGGGGSSSSLYAGPTPTPLRGRGFPSNASLNSGRRSSRRSRDPRNSSFAGSRAGSRTLRSRMSSGSALGNVPVDDTRPRYMVYEDTSAADTRGSRSTRRQRPGRRRGGEAPDDGKKAEGIDLTPLPLLGYSEAAFRGKRSTRLHAMLAINEGSTFLGADHSEVSESQAAAGGVGGGGVGERGSVTGFPLRGTIFRSQSSLSSRSDHSDEEYNNIFGGDIGSFGMDDSFVPTRKAPAILYGGIVDDGVTPLPPPTEAELDEDITIELTETDTFFILDLAGSSVSTEAPDAEEVIRRNVAYSELKERRVGNDSYVVRGMETFSRPLKSKGTVIEAEAPVDAGVYASPYVIYDHFKAEEEAEDEELEAESRAGDPGDIGAGVGVGVGTGTVGVGVGTHDVGVGGDDPLAALEDYMFGDVDEPDPGADVSGDAGDESSFFEGDDLGSSSSAMFSHQDSIHPAFTGGALRDMGHADRFRTFLGRSSRRASVIAACATVERIVAQNVFHWRQLDFRALDNVGFPDPVEAQANESDGGHGPGADSRRDYRLSVDPYDFDGAGVGARGEGSSLVSAAAALLDDGADDEGAPPPHLKHLWTYATAECEGRAVGAMAWNKRIPDILAVGYGRQHTDDDEADAEAPAGLIFCWSVKNPRHPERVIATTSAVTAVDFSSKDPAFLAVGFEDGSVSVYDIHVAGDDAATPVHTTSHDANKHKAPVGSVRWVDRGFRKGEVLCTISMDSHVKQWRINKGLEHAILIKLMRGENRAKIRAGKDEAVVWREVGGLSFDFWPQGSGVRDLPGKNEGDSYLVGSDDGLIHKCSFAFNTALDVFHGHVGPVYQIAWSRFAPEYFLSSSSDWSINLWHIDTPGAPLLSFHAGQSTVPDVVWSATSPTVFASVSEEGVLKVWDLARKDFLDPVLEEVLPSRPQALLFHARDPVIVVGDSLGGTMVFAFGNLENAERCEFPDPEPTLADAEQEIRHKDPQNQRGWDPHGLHRTRRREYHRRLFDYVLRKNCNVQVAT